MVSVSVSEFEAFGFAYLCLAFAALDLFTFLDSAEAPPLLHSAAAEVLLPLFAVAALFVAVAFTYHHLSSRRRCHAAGAGNGRRSTSGSGGLVMFALCVSAGTLEFIVFGGAEDHSGAQKARALGLAALRAALPAAATATFFLGMMMLVVSAHVRAGGEGGGTGAVQGLLLRLLTKLAAGAAAALVGLMFMAFILYGIKN